MLSFLNRRVFLLGMVTAGAILVTTGLSGCGGSDSSNNGSLTEANPYPLRGYYEGTYTRSLGDRSRSGVAQLRIMGLEDRQPEVIAGDAILSPAIEPGTVQGYLNPVPNPLAPDYQGALLGGQMTNSSDITLGFDDGVVDNKVINAKAKGTLNYNSETKTLTGNFPVTSTSDPLTSTATNTEAGTISFTLIKKS